MGVSDHLTIRHAYATRAIAVSTEVYEISTFRFRIVGLRRQRYAVLQGEFPL
jgi:hypothetical protein